ncbi:MAG TPA: FAD-dependent oxidoreductase [Ktedonobacterales bacterium]|nr:FAD-dependent oxidoreductase [Ktedonobacterales bacterium]
MSASTSSAGIEHIVIVGGGIAAAGAIEGLRGAGYEGHMALVSAEPVAPYERPPLSKGYLLGTTPEERLFPRPKSYYAEQGIELRLGIAAAGLDVTARVVRLADGSHLDYDRLLIATGGEALPLRVLGAELPGIRYLRTLEDARALAEALRATATAAGRVVVVGAGFIGAEVAAACRTLGLDVTMLEILPAPLVRVLGEELGDYFAAVHRAHGVDLRLRAGVAAFHGADQVEEVVTTSGERIPCACVVVGIGMRPVVGWLEGSGVALGGSGDGVLVDERCETSVPGVFAAGDIACWPYQQAGVDAPERVRLEHFDNALRQGEAAARNMLGQGKPFAPVPYFWSEQYDLFMQYVGYTRTWERVVFRGDPASGEPFAAFYLASGRVRAALAVNRVRELAALKKLIGAPVAPETLADEGTDLKELARKVQQG